MQSKQKQKQKKNAQNNKKKSWKVSDVELPIPILALAKSIEDYDDSIFTISNYINAYSNRPYAFDHASGTKYYRDESNFDAVDAAISLAGKSKIKEEDYVKFIFYSSEFNYQNSKSYCPTGKN